MTRKVLFKIFVAIKGIPEAGITCGQNDRLLANGTSLLNIWDSELFNVKQKLFLLIVLIYLTQIDADFRILQRLKHKGF